MQVQFHKISFFYECHGYIFVYLRNEMVRFIRNQDALFWFVSKALPCLASPSVIMVNLISIVITGDDVLALQSQKKGSEFINQEGTASVQEIARSLVKQ